MAGFLGWGLLLVPLPLHTQPLITSKPAATETPVTLLPLPGLGLCLRGAPSRNLLRLPSVGCTGPIHTAFYADCPAPLQSQGRYPGGDMLPAELGLCPFLTSP